MSTVPMVTISFGEGGTILVSWEDRQEEFGTLLKALGLASALTHEERDLPRILLPANVLHAFSLTPSEQDLWNEGVSLAAVGFGQ